MDIFVDGGAQPIETLVGVNHGTAKPCFHKIQIWQNLDCMRGVHT